ncbi:MAG: nucleotidyl transferase AbiEii/AbiGii toxin family protein [Dehalococcoidia bacterium]
MSSLAFWKAVVQDKSNFLERVIQLLEESGYGYCVIAGVAVNAYSDPVVTQDLEVALSRADLGPARALLERHFKVEEFEHSLNVYDPGSKLQVQLQKDPVVEGLIERAERRDVMDLVIPVASPRDLFRLKLAAATEPSRRASKRLKDLADLRRLIDVFPALEAEVPHDLRSSLLL